MINDGATLRSPGGKTGSPLCSVGRDNVDVYTIFSSETLMRKYLCALSILLVVAVLARAEIVRGKVKSTDAAKSTITVSDDGKDQTVKVAKDAKITQPAAGKKAKKLPPVEVSGGLSGLAAGVEVVITLDKKDGEDVATQVQVQGGKKKKKDQ